MALFKIEKGLAASLATARPTTNEGWCYFTKDDGKFYIDIETGNDLTKRVCLNANTADKLTVSAGDINTPVYFKDGIPVPSEVKLDNKADTIQVKSGNIITANNSAHTPVKGLKLYGKTIQNGTPTPEAPVPLESVGADGSLDVTVCGKNLLHIPNQTKSNAGVTAVMKDGVFTLNGTATRDAFITFTNCANVVKEQTYYYQSDSVAGVYQFLGINAVNYNEEPTFSTNINRAKKLAVGGNLKYQLYITNGTVLNNVTIKPQLTIGDSATSFEAGREIQTLTASTPNGLPGIPVSAGGNYIDENGQMWVCDEIDFARGKYVQRVRTAVFNGSETTWAYVQSTNIVQTGLYPYSPQSGVKCLCSHYVWSNKAADVPRIGIFSALNICDQTIGSLEDWKARLSADPMTVVYKLETPIETDLTAEEIAQYSALHTNYPNTTIYNDEGAGMELTYYTPTTAVQMVHSPADEGKILSIDEHGCVVLQEGNYLPLSAGEDNKLTGALGLTEGVMYNSTLPESGFNGQLFFLEDDSPALPTGGTAGQALIKNSATDGDASWKDIVALPNGGSQGQIIVKNSSNEGDAAWQNFPELNYLPLSGGSLSGSLNFANNTLNNIGDDCAIGDQNIAGCIVLKGLNGATGINFIPYSGSTSQTLSIDGSGLMTVTGNLKATQVYGAVYNDYAEYRTQFEEIKPGYCVASADNGQVYKTTEKFQACDGIVSDTFGFAIGETDECKTPLAVAGRVLAYCEGDRYSYHSGDTVCAGPEGKVMKMTREEIKEWPDRIVGIVSEIPEYEIWGSGNTPVNGRIWIKVR